MADNTTTRDIVWVAGLLEGEGCFSIAKRQGRERKFTGIGIQLVMGDEDIVGRASRILKVRCRPSAWHVRMGRRPMYRANVCGGQAAGWMMTLYPFMGLRRQSKIRECLSVWKRIPLGPHSNRERKQWQTA